MPWWPNPNGGPPIQAATNPNPAGGSYGRYSAPDYNGPPPPTDGSGGGGGGGDGGGGGGGGSGGGSNQGLLNGLDQQLNALMGAMSATNAQDFQEKMREFNIGQQNWLQQFNAQYGGTLPGGGQTLQAQQQAFSNAIAQANLTGFFTAPNQGGGGQPQYPPGTVLRTPDNQFAVVGQNGQVITSGDQFNQAVYQATQNPGSIQTVNTLPASGSPSVSGGPQQTLAGQAQQAALTGMFNGNATPAYQQELANITGQFNGSPTEAAREFNVNTQTDLAKLASSLSGPADYFKYLTALNGGRNILSNLSTGQAMPAGGAPVGATQPQTLQNIFNGLGIGGTAGGQQTGVNTGGGTAGQGLNAFGQSNTNTGSGIQLPNGLGQLPFMNQIQPTAWNSMSPAAQQFIGGAYGAAGYDPADISRAIASETPASGAAPTSGNQSYAPTSSQSLFA